MAAMTLMKMNLTQTKEGYLFYNEVLFQFYKKYYYKLFQASENLKAEEEINKAE